MREVEEVFCYGAACRQELLRAGGRGWDGRAVRDGGGTGGTGRGGRDGGPWFPVAPVTAMRRGIFSLGCGGMD